MKRLIPILLLFTSGVIFAADQTRVVNIRGWLFDVPSFLTKKVHEGPDFTVTYFNSGPKQMSLGVYEGMFPQEFAKGKAGVRKEKEKIGGEEVTWALWEEAKGEKRSFHAEVFLLIDTQANSPEKFHFFATAASAAELSLLRQTVRTAHQKTAANKSLHSTPR